jgi:hypothetical protein
MNDVLKARFKNSHHTTPAFEFIYMALSSCTFTYPLLLLPCLVFISKYLPRMFSALHAGINFTTAALGYGTTSGAHFIFLLAVLALIAVALSHGVVNLIILALWLLTYHVSTVQSLKVLLEATKNG